jgi:hypothetical protein
LTLSGSESAIAAIKYGGFAYFKRPFKKSILEVGTQRKEAANWQSGGRLEMLESFRYSSIVRTYGNLLVREIYDIEIVLNEVIQ